MKEKSTLQRPASKRTILALDTATHCGWCVWRSGKIVSSGVWNFTSKSRGRKLSTFLRQLEAITRKERVTEIVAEDIYLDTSRPKALKSLGEMRGVLLYFSEANNIPASFIEATEHKRYLCGDRYATKEATQKALQQYGYGLIESNDEADAIAILLTYIQASIRRHQPRKR